MTPLLSCQQFDGKYRNIKEEIEQTVSIAWPSTTIKEFSQQDNK